MRRSQCRKASPELQRRVGRVPGPGQVALRRCAEASLSTTCGSSSLTKSVDSTPLSPLLCGVPLRKDQIGRQRHTSPVPCGGPCRLARAMRSFQRILFWILQRRSGLPTPDDRLRPRLDNNHHRVANNRSCCPPPSEKKTNAGFRPPCPAPHRTRISPRSRHHERHRPRVPRRPPGVRPRRMCVVLTSSPSLSTSRLVCRLAGRY